jgi:thiamine biosynthesis lipoprotein
VKSQQLFAQSRNAMGTEFSIYLYAEDEAEAGMSFQAAFEEIERLDETLSNYRCSSEISRINRLASCNAVTTDPEVFVLLQRSLEFSRRSEGAFDVTVGQLMRTWGFFRGQGRYPTDDELCSSRENVGWEKLHLDPATRTVRFAAPGLELDLGAIGKGYAADRAVKILLQVGVEAALVDAGSSTLHALNAPPGKNGWTVRVPKPGDRSEIVSTVTLCNESLSTSGSYEKFFELEGNKYCHVMDPRSGRPVQGVLQTCLIATDSTTTDALSNAMFVLGPEAAQQLLGTIDQACGLWAVGEPELPRWVPWRWRDCSSMAAGRSVKTEGGAR